MQLPNVCRRVATLAALFCLAALGTVWGQDVVKVDKAAAMGAVVSKVSPEYPPIAKQLRLEGEVGVQATVAEDGSVTSATLTSGNPVLGKAATEAVMKWKFRPFKNAEGKAARAQASVALMFKL